MEFEDFQKDFLENVRSEASVTGEGLCATFVDHIAQGLIEAEVLSDFTASYYEGTLGNSKYRVDGYAFDEFDGTMNLIIADFGGAMNLYTPNENGNGLCRRLTQTAAKHEFSQLKTFVKASLKSNLYEEIEISTPCADLVDTLRVNVNNIRRYRFYIFTDASISSSIKIIDNDKCEKIPVEMHIWDIERLFRVSGSAIGRQIIEINFKDYCKYGIPCLEACSAETELYKSYLGVVPGNVLADIYDKYGSKLLEGNVRSFLSTKVAVNKMIRETIRNEPQRFFAFNNGISVTAMDVAIERNDMGTFIIAAKDFQIINGGQTTASISNARYKDKASLDGLYVQMKLIDVKESSSEDADELVQKISHSSNSQNKVSDADFFASHPFHRRMEDISRKLYAPAQNGAQYETKWFYERARGQYLQEQMRLTPAKKQQFLRQNPKEQVIKKTDLAKVQYTWLEHPDIVSKGAQSNFSAFAGFIDDKWKQDDTQFNEQYFQTTVALMLMQKYLEKTIPGMTWYEGGYRANIVCYTIALFHFMISRQFPGNELNLMVIWNYQNVPDPVKTVLIELAELVLEVLTASDRPVANVTQWCKREGCWSCVKRIEYSLPETMDEYLISIDDQNSEKRYSRKKQKMDNDIHAQTEVCKYQADMWKALAEFVAVKKMVAQSDVNALIIACKIPDKLPNTYQCKRLLALLKKAVSEGFELSAYKKDL